MNDFKKLDMSTFANGAAAELFERELEKVLENIDDVNTKADAGRTITLKFMIKPDAERDQAVLSVEAKSTIAPVKQAIGQTYFGRTNGKLHAYSQNINQSEFDLNVKPEIVESEVV